MTRTITTAAELDALPDERVLLEASGRYRYQRGTFEQCWVRLVPPSITGTTDRVWEVLVHGSEIPHSLVHTEDLDLPVTVLHDPSALVVPVVSDAAVEVLREWDVDERDVAAIRGAALDGAAWALIDRTSDTSDREPSAETIRDALRDVSAAFPLLGAAPSATREAVEHIARTLAETTALTGADAHLIVQAALALSGPSATREDVEAAIFEFDDGRALEPHEVRALASRLLARFTITPRTDR